MSKSSGPSFYEDVGSSYDPEFTKEISSKMSVPDRISLIGENSAQVAERAQFLSDPKKLIMNVPERILVAGSESHIGGREIPPELRLESSLVVQPLPSVHLATPPDVITLNEYHYPTIEVVPNNDSMKAKIKLISHSENVPVDQLSSQGTESTDMSPHNPDEELILLRRQVKLLSKRMLAIEQDNQQRQQREIALYSIGVLYFLLKGFIWLNKNW